MQTKYMTKVNYNSYESEWARTGIRENKIYCCSNIDFSHKQGFLLFHNSMKTKWWKLFELLWFGGRRHAPHKKLSERLLWDIHPGEKEAHGGAHCFLQLQQPGEGQSVLHVTSDRTRQNCFKVCQQKFRLESRKKFLHWKDWNRLLREQVESPSLEVLQKCGCASWGHDLLVNMVMPC